MKKYILTILCIINFIGIVISQENLAIELANEVLELNGIMQNHQNMIKRIVNQYKKRLKDIPDSFWITQKAELEKLFLLKIRNDLLELYKNQLTIEQLKTSKDKLKDKHPNTIDGNDILLNKEVFELADFYLGKITQNLTLHLENGGFITYELPTSECLKFKEGNFVNFPNPKFKVSIEKKDSVQISRFGDNFISFQLHYFNDCDYKMILSKTNIEAYKSNVGDELIIYPYEISGDTLRYKAISTKNNDFVSFGELIKER